MRIIQVFPSIILSCFIFIVMKMNIAIQGGRNEKREGIQDLGEMWGFVIIIPHITLKLVYCRKGRNLMKYAGRNP